MFTFVTLTTIAHVASGAIAVLMGAIALAVRKGATNHVNAGRVFTIMMGLSSFLGAILGLVKFETFFITFHAGVLGVTLVLSGWLLARRPTKHRGTMFVSIAGVNLLNTAGLIAAGSCALTLPEQTLRGFAAADYFFLAGMAGVALINDIVALLKKSLSNKHRIAQHVWRMCLGFFIAAGSAFTGPGAKAFPELVRNSGVLSLPELTIMLLMLFWLFRVLRGKGPQKHVPQV
ncbi:hypothetical protein SAMN05444287_2169 [Octadecabacter temperatus]|uniref:Uncharacterized protein n=1 Tax=Octadecabacter temperatus TaxID=1458307 RepID=A0A0K0Y1V1_9RHOB|nr:hypothetical protein [Octadecabacter temperatus]AKS44914.1 hypothetical protein OSB_03470 [Octadecabacter temperatus]SIO33718.1 hypothetical protein SAMN05444287_2169 [Octadecabacter temperatus]